jgi:hypothetical protein
VGGLRAYPRDAIHSLAHLDALSDVPGIALFVSARTLYVLQNLAVADATFGARYASYLANGGYIPVQEEDAANWALYASVVERLQLEVLEMPEVVDLLTEIRDEMIAGVLVKPGSGISISDYAVNLSAAAGTNALQSTDPESDEAWIIEAIWAVNFNFGSEIAIYVNEGGNEQAISLFGVSTAGIGRAWTGKLTLPPGAFIKAYFFNCVLNDDIYLFWHGYTVPLVS